jgi:hypothetical protein
VFFARTSSSFVIPNLLRDIEKIFFDPSVKDSQNFTAAMLAQVPFAGGREKRYNALGDSIEVNKDRIYSQTKADPQWDLLARKQVFPGIPSPVETAIDGRQITPEEYSLFIQRSGVMFRNFLKTNAAELEKMPQDKLHAKKGQPNAHETILNALRVLRKSALVKLSHETPFERNTLADADNTIEARREIRADNEQTFRRINSLINTGSISLSRPTLNHIKILSRVTDKTATKPVEEPD